MPDLLADAVAHHRRGRLKEAEALYRRVLAAEPGNADALHLLGLLAHRTGHDRQAAALIRRALAARPGKATYHFNLGIVLAKLGDAEGAEAAYRRALEIRPGDADAHNNLGLLLEKHDRADEAAACFERAVERDPRHAQAHLNLGRQRLARDRAGDALTHFERALALDAALAEAHFGRGGALMKLGRIDAAVPAFDAALAQDPDHEAARFNRGQALYRLRRLAGAEADFRALLDRRPDHAGARDALGAALVKATRLGEAASVFRQGNARHPDDPRFLVNLGNALEGLNDPEGAEDAARRAAELDPRASGLESLRARLAHRRGHLDEARQRLESLLAAPLADEARIDALFELGFVMDRAGEAGAAFQAFSEGNALRAESPEARRADAGRFIERVEASHAWFTRDRLAALAARAPGPETTRPAPVFFVGFPRSGTTLMERVLMAHPELVTTEERSPLARVLQGLLRAGGYPSVLETLSSEGVAELRAEFWTAAEAVVGPFEGRRLIDKLPLNIVDLGLAEALFPDARVIVALRDPRDACLSCFMQRFQLNDAMANFLDLEQTARTYAAVMDLWLHYRGTLGLAWHEYRYEDLVEDFERAVREVLDFIGAGWHEDVARYREVTAGRAIATPSYRQATARLTKTAIGRWRGYREEMAPVLPTLAPFVAGFGYREA